MNKKSNEYIVEIANIIESESLSQNIKKDELIRQLTKHFKEESTRDKNR